VKLLSAKERFWLKLGGQRAGRSLSVFEMDARSLSFVANACNGEQLTGSPEVRVRRVCTDSRFAQTGDLFLALRGDRFDGHDFVAEVAGKGVAAVIVDRSKTPARAGECATIVVDDTRQALGRLAARYRQDFSLPIVAVAGSNGKTTTKDLIASVLSAKFETLSSHASFNNDVGVPLTLLKLEKSHGAAVLEVGTNHPGELAPLVRMVVPKFGVITSIGREHLEFFGDMAGVAREEGALAEALPANGKLLLNGDSEWAKEIAARSPALAVLVGTSSRNTWRITHTRIEREGTVFSVNGPVEALNGEYRVRLLGHHQAMNAVFAIALGSELGLTREFIERGLLACEPASMRMQPWDMGGVCVLDDAYNANLDSMLAALNTLQEIPAKGRRIAVLGQMAELGRHTEAAHYELGCQCAKMGVGQLFAVGQMTGETGRGARDSGLNRVFEFQDVDAAGAAVRSFIKPGDVVLIKGSRSARLERITQALQIGVSVRKG
jgi:UDP-N-acetylmuramoyl-tripeptide--D-alanyl-D-alanine ligase